MGVNVVNFFGESLPSRGAWIEMAFASLYSLRHVCRSPRGERG